MAEHSMAYVAFDTSKAAQRGGARREAGRAGEVRHLGEFENTPAATAKLVRKLTAKHGAPTFCYEAGPTGYGLHPADQTAWPGLHRGGAIADPARAGQAGEDQPAGCAVAGQAVACR